MSGQARIGDSTKGFGSHGAKCCPHSISGRFVQGSGDTMTNGRPAVRLGDRTSHTCPHCPQGMAISGAGSTFINGRPAHRLGDSVTEFCGSGSTISGSGDVFAY